MRGCENRILIFATEFADSVKVSFLDSLRPRLSHDQPARLVPKKSASVAVMVGVAEGAEAVLLIRRAEREGDAWSGQAAFPGGRVSQADRTFEETARREAAEEVGVDLAGAAFLGYMREFRTRTSDVHVVPSVFELQGLPAVTPNQEVASSEWASLKELAAEQARSSYLIPRTRGETPFPCIIHRGLVIWGLTERILSQIVGDGKA